MTLSALPDIAAMILLMGVLDTLRRKHRDSSVTLWMTGLTFILLETIAVAVLHDSPALSKAAHAIALDSYVLAAVTFGWAARRDIVPGALRTPLFLPVAVPMLILTTIYGFDVTNTLTYFYVSLVTLVLGTIHVLMPPSTGRVRDHLLAAHLLLWTPITWMAFTGHLRLAVYWGLGCLYVMIAFSFRKRVRRDAIGGIVIVAGFLVWAGCFFAHPFVRSLPEANKFVEDVWTMQKFFVIIGMLILLLEDQTKRLQTEALHDVLTGLPNRRLFDDRLSQALSRASRTGRCAALFIVDLDNFKQINDIYGHPVGDVVLTRASDVLKTKIRAMDTLARCGGDEFNVIVNDLARAEDCERIAESLRAAIASIEVPPGSEPMRASVGYALFPNDSANMAELSELADVRMYKDKRTSGTALTVLQ